MTKQRRSFSTEFKREAADLVLKQEYSVLEASRSLGMPECAECDGRLPQDPSETYRRIRPADLVAQSVQTKDWLRMKFSEPFRAPTV